MSKGCKQPEIKKRYRHFVIELYCETESYKIEDVVDNIKNRFETYSYIVHDKDENEDGSLKKPHMHVVCSQKNGATCKAIAKCLSVPENFVFACSSVKSATRYLIHADDPDKFQYSLLDVQSNDPALINYFHNYQWDEGEAVMELIRKCKVESYDLYQLCQYANEQKMWSHFRRNFQIIKHFVPNLAG